ncbi:MAG: UDP-3-O-(3-hydroxymyristoyl)glucosamine N-acyltransferase [Acidobacteriia bacterium]|nr:UDP-3-O-(3-hydroxymyristoyl)glucosamine N-acyltransferase [Terriglobia bacterium]
MGKTARELAEALGLQLEGDGNVLLRGVAAPERAGPHELIYVDAEKYAARAQASEALCAIVAEEISLAGKTLLRCTKPKASFARAAELLLERPLIAAGIHATAVIAASAQISRGAAVGPYAVVEEDTFLGEGAQIGAHCVVGRGSWIGSGCRLHPRVTLYPGVRLGARVEVHAGAVLGADGFGYAYSDGRYWKFPQIGIVEIGDDVEIGANTTIDRGSLGDTRIGDGVKLDNLVHVGHNVEIGAHTVIAAQTGISGSCVLGHHVVLGGQVGLGEHCTLEDGTIAGGQAGILNGKTIRSGQTVWGTPARPLEKFKEQHAWLGRLPDLAERLRRLEQRILKP